MMKRSRLKRGMKTRIGTIVFSRFIYVYRKGLKKPVKFIRRDDFVNQMSPKVAKALKLPLDEARRRVIRSFWSAPDAITETLQTADPTITGWQIPSKIVWSKKKKKPKFADLSTPSGVSTARGVSTPSV